MATAYDAEIHPYKGKPFAWRLKQQNLLDEFKEERLPERTWTTARSGWIAKVHTRTEETKWVELFESAVRPALDECLAHPGQQGVLEQDLVTRQRAAARPRLARSRREMLC